MKDIPEVEADTSTYLITELQLVHQRASLYEQSVSTRTNLFLASLSVVIGGPIIAADNQGQNVFSILFALAVLGFFALLGFLTLAQVLDAYMSSVFLYRRMGRIRQYFVVQDPDLERFMPFAHGDDKPLFYVPYAPLRGIDAVLPMVNSFVVGMFVGLLMWLAALLWNSVSLQWSSVIIGMLISLIAWWLQTRYVRKTLIAREEKESRSGKVYYPSSPPQSDQADSSTSRT